jgi:CheY-like chemotaxis protein
MAVPSTGVNVQICKLCNLSIKLCNNHHDDQQFFIEALKEIDNSISLNLAENGVEALTKLNKMETLPDLIFMDINMPFMNGFECLTQLRKQIRFKYSGCYFNYFK